MAITCQVELYLNLGSGELSPPESICRLEVKLPRGFALSGGKRKFIVVANQDDLVLAIGPPIIDGNYLHHELLESARYRYQDGWQISGGGWLELQTPYSGSMSGDNPWLVTLNRTSGDYGNFDPRLMLPEVATQIKQTLQCGCLQFDWQGMMLAKR